MNNLSKINSASLRFRNVPREVPHKFRVKNVFAGKLKQDITMPRQDQTTLKHKLPKLDFNITNRCNFRCIHCCFKSGECMHKEFSLNKIQKTLLEFKKLDGQRIDITGGEPMMRKDVYQIIKIAKNLQLKTELVTNGSLLSKNKLQKFKKLGLDDIAISLDGSNFQTYAKIRLVNKKTYDKVVNIIKTCIELGFYTKINTVVFNSNLSDLINITKQAIQWGANEHGLYYFSPIGRGNNHQEQVADPLTFHKILKKEYKKVDKKIKLSVEVPILKKSKTKNLNISCYLQDAWHLQILPDGNVYPCAIMAAYRQPLGNLYEESLSQIWQKAHDKKFFKKNVKPLFNKYQGCVNYPECSGLIKNGRYSFVCLCRKFKIKELT